jgi:glucose/arabinose dehydrogenase
MRRTIAVAALAGLLLSLVQAMPAQAAVRRVRVVPCRSGNATCWPTAFAFIPSGTRIFYVERFTGQIRSRSLKTKRDTRWTTIGNVATGDEQGVLGIAIDPRWGNGNPNHKWIYVYFTRSSPLNNVIIRMRKESGNLIRRTLTTIPASTHHNGGVIHLGPDGHLYAVTGDAGDPARAQNLTNKGGKVLRMAKNGSRPSGQPLPGLGFSYGHRNSFGFTFDRSNGRLWQTENGPACDDEINFVRGGRNYGWGPGSTCPDTNTSGPSPVAPKWRFNPVVAPTGAAFCFACRVGHGAGKNLLVGAWIDNRIRIMELNGTRNGIAGERTLFTNGQGVLAVEAAPNNRVYFSDPDGIYRLVKR